MDIGKEAKAVEGFVLDLMKRDEIILIKGNHEELFKDCCLQTAGRLTTIILKTAKQSAADTGAALMVTICMKAKEKSLAN